MTRVVSGEARRNTNNVFFFLMRMLVQYIKQILSVLVYRETSRGKYFLIQTDMAVPRSRRMRFTVSASARYSALAAPV